LGRGCKASFGPGAFSECVGSFISCAGSAVFPNFSRTKNSNERRNIMVNTIVLDVRQRKFSLRRLRNVCLWIPGAADAPPSGDVRQLCPWTNRRVQRTRRMARLASSRRARTSCGPTALWPHHTASITGTLMSRSLPVPVEISESCLMFQSCVATCWVVGRTTNYDACLCLFSAI
jgi:hypothetical protein